MANTPKPFIWYELMTSDMKAAEDFYSAVIGWTGKPFDQPGVDYTVMGVGDRMVCGIMPIPDRVKASGGRPGWLGYILADDVDKGVKSVGKAGGAVHREPTDIPSVGRFAVVADPQGAVFMLFTPSGGDNQPVPPTTPGHVGWHELYADDWEKAFAFYAGQFGWTKTEAVDMGPMGTYQTFATGGDMVGGMMNRPEQIPAPTWLYYFNVAAADAAVSRVKDAGGQVLMGPHQVPGGSWIVQCMDPQGAMFALVGPTK